MKIIIYGANEMASAIATEFFEDHDVIVIDSNQKISVVSQTFSELITLILYYFLTDSVTEQYIHHR